MERTRSMLCKKKMKFGDDGEGWRPHKSFCQRAFLACTVSVLINRSGLTSVHCLFLYIMKAMNVQVRLRGGGDSLIPRGVPALGSTGSSGPETCLDSQSCSSELAALCPYANFCNNKSVHQLLSWPPFAHSLIVARRSRSFWSGVCHRIRVGRLDTRTKTLLEPAK